MDEQLIELQHAVDTHEAEIDRLTKEISDLRRFRDVAQELADAIPLLEKVFRGVDGGLKTEAWNKIVASARKIAALKPSSSGQ